MSESVFKALIDRGWFFGETEGKGCVVVPGFLDLFLFVRSTMSRCLKVEYGT